MRFRRDAYCCLTKNLPFKTDVSLGDVTGIFIDGKFGFITGVKPGDVPCDVWQWGSDLVNGASIKVFPTVASPLFIASDNANDTQITVLSHYIDSEGIEPTTVTTLNGQNSVPLGVLGLDVNRAEVTSSVEALGNIYITNTDNFTLGIPNVPTNVLAYIAQDYGQTEQCMLTVPIGCVMVLDSALVYINRATGISGSAQVDLRVREFGQSWVVKRPWLITTALPVDENIFGISISGRGQVGVRIRAVSHPGTAVTAVLNYYLVKLI